MNQTSPAKTQTYPYPSQSISSNNQQNTNQETIYQLQSHTLCANITYDDLYNYLYRQKEVRVLNHEEIQLEKGKLTLENDPACDACQSRGQVMCGIHRAEQSKPKLMPDSKKQYYKLSTAIQSFPNEVQLCRSSIPGSKYGVITKCLIPKGTWLGPYEGPRVKPEDVTLGADAQYMWEIFDGGQLAFYLDGRDEDVSSWMRFISCARNSAEQNLYAFQYCGNIYYRAFKEIPAGTELLVWYDEINPQFMGIPLEIRETEGIYQRAGCPSNKDNKVVVVVPPCAKEKSSFQRNQPTASRLVNPVNNPGPSSANTALPTIIGNQPPSALGSTNAHPDSRLRLPMQQAGYNIRPTTAVTHAGPRATSELLKRRRKRASLGRAELSQQNVGNIPASPGSEQLSKRSKSGGDFTTWPQRQHMSTTFVPPGSHTQVDPRLFERGRQNVTPVTQDSDPYNLHIQIDPSPEPNMFLQNQSFSNNSEHISSSCTAAEMEKTLEEIYSDDNAFQCGQCGKTFPQRSVLQIHVCPKAPYKPYHCGHCSQLFSDPNELRNHAIIHINEKPFKCGYCSRSFSGATTLNNHIRTHTGEKPFECSNCGKTFSQASQLSRHEKIPGDCVTE